MPCFRHTSPADNPAACSFSTLMICSSVNLLLRMSVSSEERTLPKFEDIYGEQVRAALHSARLPQHCGQNILCGYEAEHVGGPSRPIVQPFFQMVPPHGLIA